MPVPDAPDRVVAPLELAPRRSRGKLLQVLGVSFGVAVIVGNTILVGILRTPGDVAARLPSPALFLGVWIVGGLYALLGTFSLAEPGAMVARSGGQYVFVRRGLGEYPGFVVGWSDWISTCARGLARRDGLHGVSRAAAPGDGRLPGAGWRGPGAAVRAGALARASGSATCRSRSSARSRRWPSGPLIGLCLFVAVPARETVAPDGAARAGRRC